MSKTRWMYRCRRGGGAQESRLFRNELNRSTEHDRRSRDRRIASWTVVLHCAPCLSSNGSAHAHHLESERS